MKTFVKTLAFGLAFIVAGSALYYFYGYKDSFWLHMTAYCLIIYGWIMVAFALIGIHPKKPPKSVFKKKSAIAQAWKHRVFFLVYPVWAYAIFLNFFEGSILTDNRINHIIEAGPSAEATATVDAIRTRQYRSSSDVHAIISYPTTAGIITQAISDYRKQYAIGQQLKVRYAVNHPDMFIIVEALLQPSVPEWRRLDAQRP